MSRLAARILMFSTIALLPSTGWGVSNAVVGTCAAGTPFTTIQSAVNAASAGSTIKVCPGIYPEQIVINKSLTLTGLMLGRSAVIVPPVAGLVTSGYIGSNAFTAQVLVDFATVTINNVGVDANAAGGACFPAGRWIGIAYRNSGGTIKNLFVRNGPECANSTAIYADTPSGLKIQNNSIHECLNCIELDNATNITVSSNMLLQGGTSFLGVNLINSPGPTTISGNIIVGIETGVYAVNSAGVTVTGNTITTNQFATGIQLIGASNHMVQNNRISNAALAIVLDDTGATGKNAVINNIINDASCGISVGPNSIDTVSPNTFYVVGGWYCQ
jgi:parallel beta-helix repeat protein